MPYDCVLVDLRSKPDWYKEMVPTELTPAARINGELVYESLDILKVHYPKLFADEFSPQCTFHVISPEDQQVRVFASLSAGVIQCRSWRKNSQRHR